jgi:hypothetical protein
MFWRSVTKKKYVMFFWCLHSARCASHWWLSHAIKENAGWMWDEPRPSFTMFCRSRHANVKTIPYTRTQKVYIQAVLRAMQCVCQNLSIYMPAVEKSSTSDTKPLRTTFIYNHMHAVAVLWPSVVAVKLLLLFLIFIDSYINCNTVYPSIISQPEVGVIIFPRQVSINVSSYTVSQPYGLSFDLLFDNSLYIVNIYRITKQNNSCFLHSANSSEGLQMNLQ